MKSINERPDERSIYLWNIIGSMSNALLSVMVLMIVTRTISSNEADIFSIAWSIAQLMAIIGLFQIRTYQATDVTERFKFQHYLIFRIITIFLMVIVSIGYVFVKGYDIYKTTIILIICLFRAVEALSDVYEGHFQQKNRLDLSGKCLTFRVVIALMGFGISLLLTHNLMISCIILLLSYVLCFFIFNLRYCTKVDALKYERGIKLHYSWVARLTMAGAPIFINSYLITSIINEPKLAIDVAIANGNMPSGNQVIFNILFLPASVLTLVYIVFRPLLTRLAILWNSEDKRKFLELLGKIILILSGISLIVILGGVFLGIPVLSIFYGIDLSNYRTALIIIIVGGCLCTFANVLDNALIVIRRQYVLVIAYLVSWIFIKCTVNYFINRWEMDGAAIAYAATMLVFLIATIIIFLICYVQTEKTKKVNGAE